MNTARQQKLAVVDHNKKIYSRNKFSQILPNKYRFTFPRTLIVRFSAKYFFSLFTFKLKCNFCFTLIILYWFYNANNIYLKTTNLLHFLKKT